MLLDFILKPKQKLLFKKVLVFSLVFYVSLTLNAKEQSCLQFLQKDQIHDLQYFEGRNIFTRSVPVVWREDKNQNLEEYFKDVERKPKRIARALEDLAVIESTIQKTLVYPSSGYDGTTGFLVAPHITTVVGIDNHPFINTFAKSLKPDPYFSVNDRGRGWTVISEVDFKSFVAEIILARLNSAIPNFRLLKVLSVLDTTKDNLELSALSHGVIVFDTGEGTPIRRYIHLQSPVLNEYEMRPTSWWKQAVLKNGFRILLRKAAMSFYNYPIGLELIRHLKENQGLLIDGDNDTGSFPSYDLDQELAETPRINLQISSFGYDSVTKVYFFLSKNENEMHMSMPESLRQ